ncbi:hypothetical protein D3C74_363260 [compost metagenome]
MPDDGARVHEERDARAAGGLVDGSDGLEGPDLAVGSLERGERDARGRDGRDHRGLVDPSEQVDRDGHEGARRRRRLENHAGLRAEVRPGGVRRGEVGGGGGDRGRRELGRVQDGRALDRRDDDARSSPPTPERDRTDRRVQRRGVRGREVDLLGAGAQARSDGLACAVEEHGRATCLGVQSTRICPAVVERLVERGAGEGVQERPAPVVEVDPTRGSGGIRHMCS